MDGEFRDAGALVYTWIYFTYFMTAIIVVFLTVVNDTFIYHADNFFLQKVITMSIVVQLLLLHVYSYRDFFSNNWNNFFFSVYMIQ